MLVAHPGDAALAGDLLPRVQGVPDGGLHEGAPGRVLVPRADVEELVEVARVVAPECRCALAVETGVVLRKGRRRDEQDRRGDGQRSSPHAFRFADVMLGVRVLFINLKSI